MLAGNPAVQSVVNNVLQTNSKQNAKFAAASTSTVAVQVYVISLSKVNNYRKKKHYERILNSKCEFYTILLNIPYKHWHV